MSWSERQILLIDADEKYRERVKDFLTLAGQTRVHEVGRVKEALDVLNAESIHCIISDWDLPVANGYTLLKLVRSQARFNSVSFILMADAKSNQPELKIIAARKLQVDGFLLKPFDQATLDNMIRKIERK
jgi:DNA-binding response OmpR family regulator